MNKIDADIGYLAKKFGISERYARDLFLEARITKGKYDFLKAVDLYKQYRDDQVKELESKRDKLVEVKAEREHQKLEHERFKMEIFKREYHHTDDIELFFNELLAKIKSKVSGMPSKIAPRIATDMTKSEIEELINKEAEGVLIELSGTDLYEALEKMDEEKNTEVI